jgi:cytochrome c oxidase subunit IV
MAEPTELEKDDTAAGEAANTAHLVFAVIAALIPVTIAISFTGWEQPWRVLANLLIAVTQASLLSWFFMHLRRSDRLTWVVAAAGLFFTGILFTLTLADYVFRELSPR